MKRAIHLMLQNFFEGIVKNEFVYSDEFITRDFVHVYDFQKYYLHKCIRRFMQLVNDKHCHYFNENRDFTLWRAMSELIPNCKVQTVFEFLK